MQFSPFLHPHVRCGSPSGSLVSGDAWRMTQTLAAKNKWGGVLMLQCNTATLLISTGASGD